MKIKLETTHSEPKYSNSVEVSVNHDDLNIYEIWDEIIVPALLAFGFGESTIEKLNCSACSDQ